MKPLKDMESSTLADLFRDLDEMNPEPQRSLIHTLRQLFEELETWK